MITQFFFTLFCQVFFCLGLNMVLSEGNLLWFLRKPFVGLDDKAENQHSLLIGVTDKDRISEIEAKIFILMLKHYLAKPFVTCITCFASVWGATVFISLNGISVELLPYLIISCFASAYLQTAIYVKTSV